MHTGVQGHLVDEKRRKKKGGERNLNMLRGKKKTKKKP